MISNKSIASLSEIMPIKLNNVGNVEVQTVQGIPNIPNIPTVQTIQQIPSFLPSKINFYDPFTGKVKLTYDPTENMYITSNYSCSGINVNISGNKSDVDKVMNILRSNKLKSEPEKSSFDSSTNKKYEQNRDESQVITVEEFMNRKKQNKTNQSNQSNDDSWYYVINPLNSKIMATKIGSNVQYSGSGVIFFEKNFINPNTQIAEPTVLLVKTYRGIVEDMGGEIDKRLKISQAILSDNASKEASEESQHLFIIENTDINAKVDETNLYLNISDVDNSALYRCYFVCITGTENENLSELFKANREINVNMLRKGAAYQETEDITRFYLKDIRTAIQTSMGGNLLCKDVNGYTWNIRDRTSNCLRVFLGNKIVLDKVLRSEIQVKKNITNHSLFKSQNMTTFTI